MSLLTLQSNGYPKRFILDASNFKPSVKDTTPLAESVRGYSTVPYVCRTSKPIKRVLENHGIKVAFKPYQTISKMFPKPKDQMDKEDTRDPVYDISCANYSKSHVGETQRKFITRKSEHQKAVARRQGDKSAFADPVIKKITTSRGMRPQFSGLAIIGTKERFSRPKTHSIEPTGRYSPRSIYT